MHSVIPKFYTKALQGKGDLVIFFTQILSCKLILHGSNFLCKWGGENEDIVIFSPNCYKKMERDNYRIFIS